MGLTAAQRRPDEGVAGEGVGRPHEAEQAERVVQRAREEARGGRRGGEEEEAAGGEGVREEARRDELRVDLKEVPRGSAAGEVRVQERHGEHDGVTTDGVTNRPSKA